MCIDRSHRSFLSAYFEDAYLTASQARTSLIGRGMLFLAHQVREDFPNATAVTVEPDEARLVAIHSGTSIVWRDDSPPPNAGLSLGRLDQVSNLLSGMLAFGRTGEALTPAGWVAAPGGRFEVLLPDTDPCQPVPCPATTTGRGRAGTASAGSGLPYLVAADAQPGIASFGIDGFAGSPVETRDRVRAGTVNSGLVWPLMSVAVTLSPYAEPAHRYAGSGADLAVACTVLAASGQLPAELLAGVALVGELGLDGSVRATRSIVRDATGAAFTAVHTVIVPQDATEEIGWLAGVTVIGVRSLNETLHVLTGCQHHPAGCVHCTDRDGPHRPCTYREPCPGCRADGMEPVGL